MKKEFDLVTNKNKSIRRGHLKRDDSSLESKRMSDMKIKTKRLDSNINKPSLYKGDNLSYKNIATKSVSSSEAKSSKLVDSKLVPATFIAGYKLKKKQKTNARDSKRKAILSSLPKGRFRRFIYYLNPKNFFRFLFSREGLKFFLKLSALSFLSFVLLVLGAFIYFRKDISKLKPEEIVKRIQNSGVKYYDRTGTVMLWEQKFNKDRIVVESADIDEDIKKATVAMEDRNFYNHNGFDTKGILRAVIKSGGGKDAKGTSTITQQLVKNELLTNERTYTRKIKELILAIEVERVYNKDQILTLYLNSVNYGGTATGIETAVKRYFGNERTAKDVSIGESVFLASIPQYPTVYDPYNPYYEEDLLRERFQYGVSSLVEEKMITEEEAKTIDFNQVVASIQSRDLAIKGQYEEIKAPHFVLEVKRQLEELYGAENLENGGYEVITTIDWDLQQVADKAVADGIDDVERGNGNNAALVSTDVQTGQILAMVGSRDFNYPEFGEYNEALEPRQPGSSIKPFVYAKLFEKDNWGAGSTILDTKKVWVGLGGNGADYIPRNADDKFFGPISVREALGTSRNLPALRAIEITGVDPAIELAREMGDKILCTDTSVTCNIAVVLGSGEVKLVEHTQAYTTFARGGIYKPETYILKVTNSSGDTLQEWKDDVGTRVLNEEVAWIINDILSDDSARKRVFGTNNRQINVAGIKTAAKTGTTNENKEGWMMGYSPKIVTGVLVDRNDRGQMSGYTINQTGPIWTSYMKNAYQVKGWKSEDFGTKPAGVQTLTVNGRTDYFPSWFKKPKELPQKEFVVDKISKKIATTCTPADARDTVSATAIQTGDKPSDVEYTSAGYDLKSEDDFHNCADVLPVVSISVASNAGLDYAFNATQVQGTRTLSKIEFYVDDVLVQTYNATNGSGLINYTFSSNGSHTVRVKLIDDGLYADEATLNLNIP